MTGPPSSLPLPIPRLLLLLILLLPASPLAQTPELRGWWADTFHAALRNPAEVDALVANARAANFNAVFVEVRKRGDAYYNSLFEPKAADVQPGFDPLAYLVARAHDTNAGPRLEVHAWIVTYNIWNGQSTLPSQPTHPYRLHPEWLTESFDGQQWDGANYAFDPGHPGVQEHTFNVVMDLVSRYDVDGLHFDYVRYAGEEWGYNPVAVARFNAASGSSGRPAPDDSWWKEWRRDQITGLVRRVYLAVAAVKPQVKVSAATITWTPTATTFSSWLKSAAWSDVLQDWRAWMEAGILDLNVPMAYFRQETHATAWSEWSRFAKASRFGRHLALGTGSYLNTISNGIVQMRNTRVTPGGGIPRADGVVVYSYAVPAKQGPRADFIAAVTTRTTTDAVSPPVFSTAVAPPTMPWKTNGAVMGIGGVITDARTGSPLEGAQVELCGNEPGLLTTDANGAYGRLFEQSAPTSLVLSAPGYETQFIAWSDAWRRVAATNFVLEPDTSDLRPLDLRVTPGRSSTVVNWRTAAPSRGRVLYGLGSVYAWGGEARDPVVGTRHSVLVGCLPVGGTDDPNEHWLRVVSESEEHGTNYSHAIRLVPARWPAFAGEWDVRLTGDWTFNQVPAVGAAQGWWRASGTTGTPTATARWSDAIEVSGVYDVEHALFQGTGVFTATYDVRTARTNFTVKVSHPGGVSAAGKPATNLFLARGERPEVRMNNQVTSSGAYVNAGRMRWVYRDGQDPPPADTLPAWWAEHFFASPVAALDDADGDGASNYAEFAFGADPTNADSHLRVRIEPASEGGWRIVFSPKTDGRTYALERTAALVPGTWEEVPITEPWPAELPSGEWGAPVPPPDLGQQFYRLKVEPN